MKKTFVFFLILIFIFNLAGNELLFSILLEGCKEAMAEMISSGREKEKEAVIVITKSNKKLFRRLEKNEIEYNGMLYDVRKEEKKGGKLIIYAYADSKEKLLKENFAGNSKSEEPAKDEKSKTSGKNPLAYYLISGTEKNKSVNSISFKYSNIKNNYLQPDRELITPPPQKSSS